MRAPVGRPLPLDEETMNDADHILDFRDELERDAAVYSAIPTVSAASDTSGSVRVAFDSDTRVLSVVVGDRWKSAHRPDELGAVIVDLVVQLAAERARQWGETVAEDETVQTVTPLPPRNETPAAHVQAALADAGDSLDATAVLAQMMTMLEEVNAGMDTAMQIISARLSATHSAASAQGRVRATVDGSGGVTALVLDEEWLGTEPADSITRAINQAIASAASSATVPENPLAGTPLERYAAVVDDPSALARILMGKD
ncbi:YbaB/EbfC family nucleoid-associated protein [Leifsonia sp. YIM 134122]|uniref:YbaB/EbfC family nucleoid-associated protein n=1 Tax=Leifsonia stereocauli TaxID=3134136 RepID=A0ABU9W892_9MICO